MHMTTRMSKRRYLGAKFTAVFTLGGALGIYPLFVSSVILPLFLPLYQPDLCYDIAYYIHYNDHFAALMFRQPFAVLACFFVIQFVFFGLWCCVSLACSFFVRGHFAFILVVTAPYVFLNYLDYIFLYSRRLHYSPLRFVALGLGGHNIFAMLITAAAFAFALGLIIRRKGLQNDLF